MCISLVAVGITVLFGWSLEIETLKSILPDQSTMKINTAICFTLVGIGLAAVTVPSRKNVAIACGGVVAAAGLLTLMEYLTGTNLGIDELFMRDRGTLIGSGVPGRMSPLTATAWLALGPSIILLARGHRQNTVIAAHVLAGFAGFIAFFAAAGYAFGAEAFGGIGRYTAMAFHTALGLAVATAIVLMTRSAEGWLRDFSASPGTRTLLVQLLRIAFLLPVVLGLVLLLCTGLGLFNPAFGFALFVPCTVLALVWLALRVSHRARLDEEAMRDREAQLSAFIAQSTAGFAQVDLTGVFTLVNDRFCEIAGRSREELLTLRMQDITHPEDLGNNVPKFEAAVRDGTPYVHEKRYVRGDGSIVWVNNSVSVIRKPSGEPYGVLAVTLDVTERRATEVAVRENEARLRALTDNLPGGMVYQIATGLRGDERRFLFVSQSHEKLTGISADEVLKDPTIPYQLILEEDRQRLAEAEAESIRTLQPFDAEARFRRADGEIRWSRIISAPRSQPDGSLIWDGIQIDITDRKRLEEDLTAINETLEERVAERTAELERVHEQLRQSQKLEAMGQLTGGVAHDFNNLLTPIIGSIDLLLKKEQGPREQRLLGAAMESAERARVLVQRLLAFARRQPLQPGPVKLDKLVAGMADLIASTSGPQIKLHVDVPADLPPAKADPNQLEMAILNLSVNSRDAMPEGGSLNLAASLQHVGNDHPSGVEAGEYIRFTVSDTGEGMDEETLVKAVEPFFSTKGIGKGTGLGLSMVHGLASQLGGAMSITSKRGFGTMVELLLPTADEEDGIPEGQALAAKASGGGAGIVLLVDDEEAVRASTAELLADLGYEVVEASSAQQALEWLDKQKVDLVVTDHLMPGMTGTDLARHLKRRIPPVPALVVSGYAELEAISPDLPRLSKPFRRHELAACLESLKEAAA